MTRQKLFLATVCVFVFISNSNISLAQSACGELTLLDPFGGPSYTESINDCSNPFNQANEDTEVSLFIDEQEITEGATISILLNEDVSASATFPTPVFSYTIDIFKQVGSDYVQVDGLVVRRPQDNTLSFAQTGDYIAVIQNSEPPIVSSINWWDKLVTFLVPKVFAFDSSTTSTVINFTVTEEPLIDPLILQYAPILYMHPDEDYLPMNVEAFVEASALWNGADTQLYNAESLTFEEFEDVAGVSDTRDYYLAFSDPDTAGSIDLGNAKNVYEELVNSGLSTTTIYYHKMEDGYVDSFGKEHNYIVLQYWFFYAMNNWGEHGGYNNHEGDWESVFIFLDADTEEPEYVAFSSHLNDGFPQFVNKQYASVRKDWDSEIETISDRVKTYVALGSHANYAHSGDYFIPNPAELPELIHDQTSVGGIILQNTVFSELSQLKWNDYSGYWGTQINKSGNDGPQGPKYIELTSQSRYSEPIEWAGIDNVDRLVINEIANTFDFSKQKLQIVFTEVLDIGTELSVDFHEEVINFGDNLDELSLLPNFWDLETSIEENTFQAEVSFEYNQEFVNFLEDSDSNLAVYYYNPENNLWEVQESQVDIENNTVTFTTNHFSRYALGLTKKPTLEELYMSLSTLIKDSGLSRWEQRWLLSFVNKSKRLSERKHFGFLPSKFWPEVKILDVLLKNARRYQIRDKLTLENLKDIKTLVDNIQLILINRDENNHKKTNCSLFSTRNWFSCRDGGWIN